VTISAVGSPTYANNPASTVSVNPTAIGDVLILQYGYEYEGTMAAPTPSGGGVTTWVPISTPPYSDGCLLWMGIVTSTGPSAIAISSFPVGQQWALRAQQFHSTAGNNWRVIVSGFTNIGGTESSGDYPSLSPNASNQLYFGALRTNGATTGSTAGFVYDNSWSAIGYDSFVYFLNATNPTAYAPAWSASPNIGIETVAGVITADGYALPAANLAVGVVASLASPTLKDYITANVATSVAASIATNSGFAPTDLVPWQLPIAINDHGYMLDFSKSRITTLQVRRQSADDSVEPGEQTLSAAGVWPRAQDNYFLGAGQEFLDNRFAFESVYVHSGEYPSVRTRFWKSQGIVPWNEGKITMQPEYASIATSSVNLLLCVCGNYLYRTDGIHLWWTMNPVGVASPTWTQVTLASTTTITSITSDGSRVWVATGTGGVLVTVAGTTTSAAAATPAALKGIGGAVAAVAGAGTVNATNLPNGSTNWYITEVDAFGNETAAVEVTQTVASTPINLTWNPDTNASNFNVYRGTGTLIYTGDVPSFVDDGTVTGTAQTRPTVNGTGTTPYKATFLLYSKGHLIASTGRDLVEVLASGNITFIFQHDNPSFVFNCGCELPSAIIVAGNAGGTNSGLAFVGAIQPDSTNNGATLAPPTWATALPYGEQINAIAYNAGSILLGTTLGVRTGTDANDDGVFDINPVIEDPGSVLCTAAWAQYQYFGWSNYAPAEPWAPNRPVVSGLGRADLSQYTTPGVAAYATDVMGASIGSTTQVVVIAGVPYFVVDNAGSYTLYGPDGNVVASAWLEPGWVRYGTLENKIVTEVDFQHQPLPAGASVSYAIVYEDTTTVNPIVTNSAAGSTTIDTPEPAGLMVGDRFMPVITLTAATGQLSGPTFLSHITKAMVTTLRQDECLLALKFGDKVRTLGPASKTQYMNPAIEYLYLKGYEGTGQIVVLTMGGLVYSAFIDQVMYEPDDEMTNDRQWFAGTCTVKLITLSRTSSQ
jgi:hypothetical protein